MRNVLALGAATVCTLGAMGYAFASDETLVEAFYTINESYTVTFPAEIEFEGYEDDQVVFVEADEVILNDGGELNITMTSANGALVNGDSSITYMIANGENAPEDIVADTPFDILTVESGDRHNNVATLTFTSGDDTNVTLAGKHSDTLTFIIEVDDGIAFMQDIDEAMEAKIASGEITSIKDRRDNKIYTVTKFGYGYWLSDNLAYIPENDDITWEEDGIYVDWDSGEVYYSWDTALTVCPEGWELPSRWDFMSFVEDYNTPGPFGGTLGGLVVGDELDEVGYSGNYWSSSVAWGDASKGLSLRFYDDGAEDTGLNYIDNNKANGLSVHCMHGLHQPPRRDT